MEISWMILAVVFAVNLAYIGVMHLAQVLDKSLPRRHSIISGTHQKFLYMPDFWTTTYGDMFGVSLITNAFVHLAVSGHIDYWQWIAFVVIAIASALIFVVMCFGKEHKPDAVFPNIGKISWNGIMHLPYFGTGIAVTIMCIWHLFTGNLRGLVMWIGLAGGALYIACYITDIKSGNFDTLKKIKTY